MTIIDLLKRATKLINQPIFSEKDKEELKNLLCYLSEWRKNNLDKGIEYPQMSFILYNASIRLRTFGYNRLNKFLNETINNDSDILRFRDQVVEEFYKTESGFVLDKAQKGVLDDFEEHAQEVAWQKILCRRFSTTGKNGAVKQGEICLRSPSLRLARQCAVVCAPLSGTLSAEGSAGGAIGEHQLKLAEHQIPVLASCVPVPHDSLRRQV